MVTVVVQCINREPVPLALELLTTITTIMDMPDLSMMSAARMTTAVYSPPKPGDSRAPCPALNTLANYGYL